MNTNDADILVSTICATWIATSEVSVSGRQRAVMTIERSET